MKAIPLDSNVKLRIRRPEHKKRKIVNMDKWLSSATGRIPEDPAVHGEDDFVNVHVVFSMPLTSESSAYGDGNSEAIQFNLVEIPHFTHAV